MATAIDSSLGHEIEVLKDAKDPGKETDDIKTDEETYLMIPIRDEAGNESEEAISFKLSELPAAETVVGVLQAETADLRIWLDFSVEYFRQNLRKDFEYLMNMATSDEAEEHYKDDIYGRVALLNAYAAYCIEMSKKTTKEKEKASEYLKRATKLLNRASDVDRQQKFDIIWVTKALLDLCNSNVDAALKKFDTALVINPGNLLATLGMAKIYFKKTNYRKSLDLFRNAIAKHAGCPVSARVGLGLCFYKLNNLQRAKECFQRALDLEEDNVDAMVSLAVLELSNAASMDDHAIESTESGYIPRKRLIESAMKRLSRAYDLQPSNPMACIHLAHHFFQKDSKDLATVKELSRSAVKKEKDKALKAEVIFIGGRSLHYQATEFQDKLDRRVYLEKFLMENSVDDEEHKLIETEISGLPENTKDNGKAMIKTYDHALDFFSESNASWPDYLLTKFHFAQLKLARLDLFKENSKTKEALKSIAQLLEYVLKKYPTDRDTLFFYGSVLMRMGKKAEAIAAWKKISDFHPDDAEVWVELATTLHRLDKALTSKSSQIQQETAPSAISSGAADRDQALKCYQKAVFSLKQHGKTPSMEILNNMGVLKYALGDLTEAEADLKASLAVRKNRTTREMLGLEMEAEAQKDDGKFILIRDNVVPYYNLAIVKEKLGKFMEAESIYKEISKNFPQYIKAAMRLGGIYMKRGRFEMAHKCFLEARTNDKGSLEPLLLLICLSSKSGNKDDFKKYSDDLVKRDFDNAYFRILKANTEIERFQLEISMNAAPGGGTRGERSKLKAETQKALGKGLDKSFASYDVISQGKDVRNIFAANGAGCYLAIKGALNDARSVFEKVKDSASSMNEKASHLMVNKTLHVNLGHIATLNLHFDKAVGYYEQCLRRFLTDEDYIYTPSSSASGHGQDDCMINEVSNFLARAYCLGRRPENAKALLQNVIRNNPGDVRYWYNLALCEFFEGNNYLKLKQEQKTADGFRDAIECIERSKEIFQWVSETRTKTKDNKKSREGKKKKEAKAATETYLEEPMTPPGSPMVISSLEGVAETEVALLLKEAKKNREKLEQQKDTGLLRKAGLLLEEQKADENESAAVEAEESLQPQEIQNTEIEGNKRSLKARAPFSANYTKTDRAILAVEGCKLALKGVMKEQTQLKKREEKEMLKRLELQNQKKQREAEKDQKEEAERMKELRKKEEIKRRLEEQTQRNTLVTGKLREDEETRKASESHAKRRKKGKKKDMDGFIVDEDQMTRAADAQDFQNGKSDDSSSGSDEDSSDAAEYQHQDKDKKKRLKITRKRTRSEDEVVNELEEENELSTTTTPTEAKKPKLVYDSE